MTLRVVHPLAEVEGAPGSGGGRAPVLKIRAKNLSCRGREKPGGLEIHSACFQTARVLSLLAEYDP